MRRVARCERRGVGRCDVRDDEQAEEAGRDRQRRRRDEQPAGEDRRKAESVERGLRRRGEQAFRPRAAFCRRRRLQGARTRCAAVSASAEEAERLVELVEVEFRSGVRAAYAPWRTRARAARKSTRRPSNAARPPARSSARGRSRAAQSPVASLEMTSSMSRETRGKPEFMPNSSRSMWVRATKASRDRPPCGSRRTSTSTASEFGYAEQRQLAGDPHRVVVDLLHRP